MQSKLLAVAVLLAVVVAYVSANTCGVRGRVVDLISVDCLLDPT